MVGLVTGASRGLGFELIQMGLSLGYDMIACWIGNEQEVKNLKKLKEDYGRKLQLFNMDVTDEKVVLATAGEFGKRYKQLDFIVNNAGVLFESKYDESDPILELDINMFRKTLEVNTVGPAIVLKAFIPYIYRSATPCIINITSEAGHLAPGGHNYMAYSISKHAINMYTQKIRNYLTTKPEKEHVRIFMVHPGRMQTVMGAENAQIVTGVSAEGIYRIVDGTINPILDVPFINYKGEQMPY